MMDIKTAKSLSIKKLKSLYKIHLQNQNFNPNTVGTMLGDSFYLMRNSSADIFWDVIYSTDFENIALKELSITLKNNSSGNTDKLVGGYVNQLKRLRDFILETEVEPEKDNETALKDFLLDIDCLNDLNEWTNKFNLFDILKISRTEIRHSNMLAWLMSPSENHGLGDRFLRGLIQHIFSFCEPSDNEIFNTLLMDFYDFTIKREWQNIDLLAISDKFVLCIENKIDSSEHDNQLNKYTKIIEDNFPNHNKMYIYLTPKGDESSDSKLWYSMSYQDILKILNNIKSCVTLSSDAEMLINNYIDTLRRDIVGDEKLAKICAQIYEKHKKALDLIFENKPDKASELTDIIMEWANQKEGVELNMEKSSKSYIRFTTKAMSEILPNAEGYRSGWGTENFYFYEIKNNIGKEFFIQLIFSSSGIPDKLRTICDKVNDFYPAKMKKDNWQWRTPYSTKHFKFNDENYDEQEIFQHLDKMLEQIKTFEKDLKNKLIVL